MYSSSDTGRDRDAVQFNRENIEKPYNVADGGRLTNKKSESSETASPKENGSDHI